MSLKNGHFVVGFKILRFFDGIAVIYDGENDPKELEIFELALALVAQLADKSFPIPRILLPNVYFLETNSLTLTLDDDTLGCFHQAICFPLAKWRAMNFIVINLR